MGQHRHLNHRLNQQSSKKSQQPWTGTPEITTGTPSYERGHFPAGTDPARFFRVETDVPDAREGLNLHGAKTGLASRVRVLFLIETNPRWSLSQPAPALSAQGLDGGKKQAWEAKMSPMPEIRAL